MVPRIATARLLLREVRFEEFDDFAANVADPVVQQYTSGAMDRRKAWQAFTSMLGQWMLTGTGWWGVELRETGQVIGQVGTFVRDTNPAIELGWTLYPRAWGHGYAREAAAAARDFGFDSLGAKRVIAHIAPENARSIGVAEHLGMRHETDVDFYGSPSRLYARER